MIALPPFQTLLTYQWRGNIIIISLFYFDAKSINTFKMKSVIANMFCKDQFHYLDNLEDGENPMKLMMELFSPSLTTTDDLLDKLIQELDKEQNAQSVANLDFLENGGMSITDNSLRTFDQSSINQLSLAFNQPVAEHQNSSYSREAGIPIHSFEGDGRNDPLAQTSLDWVAPCVSFSPPSFTAHAINTGHLPSQASPTLSADFAVGDTVEIEYSQEHSYATSVQQHNNNGNDSFLMPEVRRIQMTSLKENIASSATVSPNFATTTWSSHSSPCGSSFLRPNCDKKLTGQQQLAYNGNLTGLRSSINVEQAEERDKYFDPSDFFGERFTNAFDERGSNIGWAKRGSKRKGRPQFNVPFSFQSDEKLPLLLSDEERTLCEKEGIKLPTRFPLTKQEERELRRVRRKIRNKLSAQESRRKKSEYILSLEDRVRSCDQENQSLRRQVEALSDSNKTLVEQLKRLQSSVGNGSAKQTVQAGTCLAVLLLSFALLVVPNNNLLGKQQSKQDKDGQFAFNQNEETLPSLENNHAMDYVKHANNQAAILPVNGRTLLPQVNEAAFGAYRYDYYANVAELDVDPWSFHLVDDGGGGGDVAAAVGHNVKRPSSPKPQRRSPDCKRRRISDGSLFDDDADRFAAVVKNENELATSDARRIDLMIPDVDDFRKSIKQSSRILEYEFLDEDGSADHFAALASKAENLASTGWLNGHNDSSDDDINRLAMQSHAIASVLWGGNRAMIKADDM